MPTWRGSAHGGAPVVHVAGVPLTDMAPDSAARHIAELATARIPLDVHLVNAYTVSLADTQPDLGRVITEAGMNLADGKPLTWAARRLAGSPLHQVRGPGLFEDVLALGHEYGLRHYLLGGTEETLAKLQAAIALRHSTAAVAGAYSPPFRPLSPEELTVQDGIIRDSGANIVWVGLGTPRQDFEVARLVSSVGVVAVAVGAAFDFSAGDLRRSPEWMSKFGLEWLFRFAMEPRRLWRRYTVGNVLFLRAVVRHRRPPGGRA